MADSNKAFLTKLNNENYFVWKYKMELLLMKEKLWSVLNETKPEPTTNNDNAEAISSWQIRDDQARAWIGLSVEDNQLSYIRNKTTAKDTWTALKIFHEKDSMTNKISIIRRICGLKMIEGGNVGEHLNEITNLFQKLSDLGEEQLSTTWHVGVIVSSLPRSYDNLIVALEARPEADVTLSLVQSKLITEYQRRKEADSNEKTDSALKITAKFKEKIKCFFCKRSGHVRSDCGKYKSWKEKHTKKESASTSDKVNKVEEDDSFLFVVSSKKNCDGWILDSGATKHISSNKSFFVSLDQAECKSLNVANGESVGVKGKGVCRIEMVNKNGALTVATVTDVLYVPDIQGNLLSVKRLLERGYAVNFIPNSETCEIKFGDKQVAIADAQSNLFKLRQPNKAYAVCEHKENCIHHWHRIFGHRDPDAIKHMYSKGLVDRMKIVDCDIKVKCEVCLKGKTTRLPFPKQSLTTSTAPLDLIHTDVCGPMQTVSPSGKRYVLTFIDDFSRYTVIYLLKNKSEVDEKIKEYVAMVKNKFSTKPKVIRSDRGGEYTGKNVVDFLKSDGIQIQYTTPYTPQQNGVAERKNRTLIEMARCMLLDANLPKKFWAEAVNTANYVQNRLPCRAIEKTPYEAWNQRKPDIKHFSIFGTKCFVHLPSEKRRKLDDTSTPMIFVGYDENSKGFRCFDPVKNKLVISRDVRFTENSASAISVGLSSSDANVESSTVGIDMDKSTEMNPNVRENVGVRNNSGNAVPNVEFESFAEGLNRIFNEENNQIEENRNIPIHEMSVRRISQRKNKAVPPQRLIEEIDMIYKVVEPKNLSEALSSDHKAQWIRAMKNEMDSLKQNEAWKLCELPKDRKAIGCKWVYKLKTDAEGKIDRHKARLVAQGFSQKYGTDYDQVFAPVARQTTFRTLLSIASKEKLIVRHIDVKTAFLNGKLNETIYMKQPPGFEENSRLVCLLQKGLYGLKQAAKLWNDTIHEVLIEEGFQQSKADQCLYSRKKNDEWSFLLIYVDDMIVAAKSIKTVDEIKEMIASKFELQDLGEIKFYLGIEIIKDAKNIYHLCQSKYIQRIVADFGLSDAKISNVPMNVNYEKSNTDDNFLLTNTDYQKLIGCLLYISVNTRPDISASVSILAQRVQQPRQQDWNELKRVLRYLKGTANLKLALSSDDDSGEFFYGYADANWAENRNDRKSNTGYVFIVNGGIISWACRKQNCVALSSTEAEFIALSEACKEAVWLRRLLKDLQQPVQTATTIYEDNQSCLKLIEEEKMSNRTKHVDTRYHFVKDYVQQKFVSCVYCCSVDMLADLLTKPLPPKRHIMMCERCGLY